MERPETTADGVKVENRQTVRQVASENTRGGTIPDTMSSRRLLCSAPCAYVISLTTDVDILHYAFGDISIQQCLDKMPFVTVPKQQTHNRHAFKLWPQSPITLSSLQQEPTQLTPRLIKIKPRRRRPSRHRRQQSPRGPAIPLTSVPILHLLFLSHRTCRRFPPAQPQRRRRRLDMNTRRKSVRVISLQTITFFFLLKNSGWGRSGRGG